MNYYNYTQQEPIFSYVNGLEGAKQFQLPLNKTALLMDTENPVFFLKSINSIGQATIKAYKFEETTIQEKTDTKYATQDDIKNINDRLSELINRLNGGRSNESNNNTTSV